MRRTVRAQAAAAADGLVEVELHKKVKQRDTGALRVKKADGEVEDEHYRIDAVRQKLLERFAAILREQHERKKLRKRWWRLGCFHGVA